MDKDYSNCGKNKSYSIRSFSVDGSSFEDLDGSGIRDQHRKQSSIDIAVSKRDLKDTP